MSDAIEIRLRLPVPLYLYTCTCGASHHLLDKFWCVVDWESSDSRLFCVACSTRPADALDWSGYNAVVRGDD